MFFQVVGRPVMPPYWSLGFHLCRYGYNSIDNMKMVRARMDSNQIPQDTQWNDIDYMDRHLDFTIDPKNFNGLSAFSDEIHNKGMHYILMAVSNFCSKWKGVGKIQMYSTFLFRDRRIAAFVTEILISYWKEGVGQIPEGGATLLFPFVSRPCNCVYIIND